jgi:DNA-binding IclR family transcriptional regulator
MTEFGASASPEIRQVVDAVAVLSRQASALGTPREVSQREVCRHLGLDRASVSRRVTTAKRLGMIYDLETVRGRPSRLVLGDRIAPA